jgi:hypothetical protein
MEHARNGTVTLISSPALLTELARVIDRPKFNVILLRTHTSRAQTLAEVRLLAEVIDPPPWRSRCAATRMMTRCWRWPLQRRPIS